MRSSCSRTSGASRARCASGVLSRSSMSSWCWWK
ncbi:Uncharacterised protein [Bordetella pertussis]|nr:Uncharacterised protein [Bordetella pertussis]